MNQKPLARAAKKILLYIKDNLIDFRIPESVFLYLDRDCDGLLTKNDFLQFYLIKHNEFDAEVFASKIMKNLESSNPEYIKYTEFLEAAIDEMLLAESNNLHFFYKLLYENCPNLENSLHSEQLRQGVGVTKNELKIWVDYIQGFSQDNIDFTEFSNIVYEGISK